MTTQADGTAAADAVAQKAAAATAAFQKFMGLLQAPAAGASTPPSAAPAAPPPAPVVTSFAWATAQMQAGLKVTRPGWGDKAVFLGAAGQELMRLPSAFPTEGLVVPWLYAPGDVDATDWMIAT
jgi:Protein of unknown function (DUF2829)